MTENRVKGNTDLSKVNCIRSVDVSLTQGEIFIYFKTPPKPQNHNRSNQLVTSKAHETKLQCQFNNYSGEDENLHWSYIDKKQLGKGFAANIQKEECHCSILFKD